MVWLGGKICYGVIWLGLAPPPIFFFEEKGQNMFLNMVCSDGMILYGFVLEKKDKGKLGSLELYALFWFAVFGQLVLGAGFVI